MVIWLPSRNHLELRIREPFFGDTGKGGCLLLVYQISPVEGYEIYVTVVIG